jgi:hypothetical protein
MDPKRLGTAAMTIVVAFAISAGSAFAAEKDDVVATVHQYLDSLDEPETASAICDSDVSILDEFPPHEWHGPTACADWWKAYNAYNEKSGITDGDAPLGTPWTVDVTGDRALFCSPHDLHLQAPWEAGQGNGLFCCVAEAHASRMAHYWVGILQTEGRVVFYACLPGVRLFPSRTLARR